MSSLRAEAMAERLGLTEHVIRQLQALGYLERLAIGEEELRLRALRGYLLWLSGPHAGRGRRGARRT